MPAPSLGAASDNRSGATSARAAEDENIWLAEAKNVDTRTIFLDAFFNASRAAIGAR